MKKQWKRALAAAAALFTLTLSVCACGRVLDGEDMVSKTYTPISQEKAREMMEQEEGCVIVDVRRQDEFESGHIPGAVCIPNETIEGKPPGELPDPDQIILVYCRSGNRSRQAAEKLAGMGYTNVYEFGGIMDWTGEVVTDE